MKKISLSIPKPCHENWEAMTTEGKGRFCGFCQKSVVDFSSMSDRQIAEFFKKPAPSGSPGGGETHAQASVCGRFHQDQLERDIEIPRKRIPWVRYFFQFSWPAFMLFLKSCGVKENATGDVIVKSKTNEVKEMPIAVVGYTMPEITAVDTLKKGKAKIEIDSRSIVGKIAPSEAILMGDTTHVQIQDAEVASSIQDVKVTIDTAIVPANIITHTMGFVSRMPDSKCKISKSKKGSPGKLNNKKIKVDEIKKDSPAFSPVPFVYKPVVVDQQTQMPITSAGHGLSGVVGGLVITPTTARSGKVIQKEKAINDIKPSPEFLIYPNPAHSNSTLSIEIKKVETGAYSLSISNSSGEIVQVSEVYIDKKLFTITLSHLTSGTYFIRLTNKKTTRSYTERFIVQ